MGLFGNKVVCSHCEKEISSKKYKIIDGWICSDCLKMCNPRIVLELKKLSLSDVRKRMEIEKIQKEKLLSFNATKKIGTYIEIDEDNKQWLIYEVISGRMKNPIIFNYEDIISFELIEDGESIIKGGLGGAAVGAFLCGGVGAILGGITGKRKQKKVVNSLKIKITVNNISKPTIYFDMVKTKMKTSSFIYKSIYKETQEILSTLAIMKENANNTKPVEDYNTVGEFIYCRKCGNKLPDDSGFCNKCGEKIL
ncbi:hypothetical protein SH2C18_03420 [Clostridium sediminicola]|uniref:zinc ribbon domain-containing protein n=1 Tax=Clostridium sediminicola TaxID=3114879 RepID=UPI0031F259E3